MLLNEHVHLVLNRYNKIYIETQPVKTTEVGADPRYHPRLLMERGWKVIVSWEWSHSCVVGGLCHHHLQLVSAGVGGTSTVGCKHL